MTSRRSQHGARAQRYVEAADAYEKLQAEGKPVERVVGHSLGGSVALQLQRDKNIPKSRTFGAPVMDFSHDERAERYRHPLDPVSIFDRSAHWGPFSINPHSYGGFR